MGEKADEDAGEDGEQELGKAYHFFTDRFDFPSTVFLIYCVVTSVKETPIGTRL